VRANPRISLRLCGLLAADHAPPTSAAV